MSEPGPSKLARIRSALRGKFVKDTIFLQGGMFVTMGTYLLTSVLLARGLGPEQFGRYTTAFTLFTMAFFVANLGVTTATVSLYSKACGQGDEDAKAVALAAFTKAFSLMIVAILALGLFMPAFAEWWRGDREIGTCALWLCAAGAVTMVQAFVLVILQGARRMRDFVLYNGACDLVRLFALLLAILSFQRLPGVILAYIGATVANALIGLRVYQLARRDPSRPDAPPPLSRIRAAMKKVRLRTFFSQSIMLAVNKNGGELSRHFTLLCIYGNAGPASVGRFRVAFYYVWAIQQLLGGVARNVLPSLGQRYGKSGGDVRAFKRDVRKVMWLAGLLFMSVTLLFVLIAPVAVHILYGPRYAEATTFIYVLALGHIALGFAVVNETFYIYTNRLRTLLGVNLFIYALAIPGAWVLTRWFGAIGGAMTIAGAQLLNFIHFAIVARYVYSGKGEESAARPATAS